MKRYLVLLLMLVVSFAEAQEWRPLTRSSEYIQSATGKIYRSYSPANPPLLQRFQR